MRKFKSFIFSISNNKIIDVLLYAIFSYLYSSVFVFLGFLIALYSTNTIPIIGSSISDVIKYFPQNELKHSFHIIITFYVIASTFYYYRNLNHD